MTTGLRCGDAAAVVAQLRRHGRTVAAAESLTGGLLCAALVAVPGASDVVRGGLVAYAADLKASLLDVSADLLERVGTVAVETAEAMAEGARHRFGADIGVATTGVAGPDQVEGKPVGLAFVALAGHDGSQLRRLQLEGDREAVRLGAVNGALTLLLEALASPASA